MCGRFALSISGDEIRERFDLPDSFMFEPRYNIPPGRPIPAIRTDPSADGNGRTAVRLHWGLVPFWADDPSSAHQPINARSETVDEKPTFREAFKKRRCLIPATGFYEWTSENGSRRPYFFRLESGDPFAFAGLWERWEGTDDELESCAILTTRSNEMIEPVHDRMPVLLHPSRYDAWLAPATDADRLDSFLTPYQSSRMDGYPVGKHVNNPENDDPSCVEPA